MAYCVTLVTECLSSGVTCQIWPVSKLLSRDLMTLLTKEGWITAQHECSLLI